MDCFVLLRCARSPRNDDTVSQFDFSPLLCNNARTGTLGGQNHYTKDTEMAKIELSAKLREVRGKGAARAIRNSKNIPAVIYGNNIAPTSIEMDGHTFGELIRKPGLKTRLFVIDVAGKKENAMLIDIQYHPVKDTPMHADFKRIDVKKPVTVNVPLNLINVETSKGLKSGGALGFAVRHVVLVGLIDDIPEKLDVDLLNLNIMDTIHGKDLVLPKGCELGFHQADLAFVTITGKMKEEAAPAAAATTAAAAPAAAKPAATAAAKPAAATPAKK